MEFHLPGPIRTFKDFFIHLGVITLGILIAPGLEQIVEAHHRVKIGQDAVASFRRELTDNRTRVTRCWPRGRGGASKFTRRFRPQRGGRAGS